MPEKMPEKLFVVMEEDGEKSFPVPYENLDAITEDGTVVGVYRLCYERPLRVRKNLALRKPVAA